MRWRPLAFNPWVSVYQHANYLGQVLFHSKGILQTDRKLTDCFTWTTLTWSVANWLGQPDMPLGRRHSTVIYRADWPFRSVSAGRRRGTRACHFNANAFIVRRARHGKHHEPDRISFQFAFAATAIFAGQQRRQSTLRLIDLTRRQALCCIRYDTIRYIYVSSKADARASLI